MQTRRGIELNRKIVFFDLDGTVLNNNKEILQSTKKAIHGLQESGIYTAIATGRGPQEMLWACKELNIDSYVAINGAYAVYNGIEVHLENIAQEEVRQLIDTVERYKHSAAFITHNDMWALDEDHPLINECLHTLKMDYPRVDKELHMHRPVNQAVVYCQEKHDDMYRENHPNLEFIRFHELGMDAIEKGNSKEVGIKAIMKAGGFKRENTYAFGDELNDLGMLSFVECGIAMGNSVPEVKEIADYITTSNEADGIWNACKQLGLLKSKVV